MRAHERKRPAPERRRHNLAAGALCVYLRVAWLILLALATAVRRPVAPLLTARTDAASLGTRADRDTERTAGRSWRAMIAEWRWVWTEAGTYTMVACVAESTLKMVVHSYSRAVHVHLALGMSKGLALVLICVLVLAQVVAGAVLVLPAGYNATGSIGPSAVLGAGLWFEALLFGDLNDVATLVRIGCLSISTAMLALFRFDRRMRNYAAQLPDSGVLLRAEAIVRRSCTAMRTGVVCPPVAVALLLCNVYSNPFWRAHGILYEWYHGRFQAGVAIGALLFLLAGQDTKAHVVLGEKLEYVYHRVMLKREDLLGLPRGDRHLGSKKAL